MAVAASIDCLTGFDRSKVGGLYFATTTPPYRERQSAGMIATVLDLRPDVRTYDFADTIRTGTGALLAACDAAKAGSVENIVVCASDCRLGRPGSAQEVIFGEAGAALMVGNSEVIATLEGSYTLTYDFMDQWRADGDKYNRMWEDRWIRDEGYTKFLPEVILGLLKKYKLNVKDFAKVVIPCIYLREFQGIAKSLQLDDKQVQKEMLTTVGDTGSAHALMMLVAALEEARPGDKIIVTSYGNGADAMFFQVTEHIEKVRNRRGIKKNLTSRKELANYERYLSFRDILPMETGFRGEVGPTKVSVAWREQRISWPSPEVGANAAALPSILTRGCASIPSVEQLTKWSTIAFPTRRLNSLATLATAWPTASARLKCMAWWNSMGVEGSPST
jgi:3-hydroxy-3-methylglutaryl CoA synthase